MTATDTAGQDTPPRVKVLVAALRRVLADLETESAAGGWRDWDNDELAAVWRDAKQSLYDLGDVADGWSRELLARVPRTHRGWAVPGRPVMQVRRWETEVLDVDAFQEWLSRLEPQVAKEAEVEWVPKLNRDARTVARRTIEESGEKVPGISAGYSAPYLTLGRAPS